MGGPLTEDETGTYCSAVTDRGDYLSPPSACEEPALTGSELCYWHDPDGWEFDQAENLDESRRERELW